jgi:hypothetical protein
MNANRFDMHQLMKLYGAWLANDIVNYLLPAAGDSSPMNVRGREQGEVAEVVPSSNQSHSAIYQAGCIMHCGMASGLYCHVRAQGVTMQDAISSWFTSISKTTARESRRWVDTGNYLPARGSCWGYSDVWIPLFRSLFLAWVAWAVHLTQLRRGGKHNVWTVMRIAHAAAQKLGRPLPAAFGRREHAVAGVALWLVLFLLCLAARNL